MAQGRGVLVAGRCGVDEDLVRHVTEIVTSLCARLHGRVAANRVRRSAEAAIEDVR